MSMHCNEIGSTHSWPQGAMRVAPWLAHNTLRLPSGLGTRSMSVSAVSMVIARKAHISAPAQNAMVRCRASPHGMRDPGHICPPRQFQGEARLATMGMKNAWVLPSRKKRSRRTVHSGVYSTRRMVPATTHAVSSICTRRRSGMQATSRQRARASRRTHQKEDERTCSSVQRRGRVRRNHRALHSCTAHQHMAVLCAIRPGSSLFHPSRTRKQDEGKQNGLQHTAHDRAFAPAQLRLRSQWHRHDGEACAGRCGGRTVHRHAGAHDIATLACANVPSKRHMRMTGMVRMSQFLARLHV